MRNAGLEETQAGIKIAGRNINNLIYADDTTLMVLFYFIFWMNYIQCELYFKRRDS